MHVFLRPIKETTKALATEDRLVQAVPIIADTMIALMYNHIRRSVCQHVAYATCPCV